MGLLDSVIGALGQQGQGPAPGQPDLLSLIVGMLANSGAGSGGLEGQGGLGGLGGLLSRAQQGGLGDIVQSWIGSGQNLPISPDQLQSMLGDDVIGQLAQQLGLSRGDTAGQLSQVLPQVVDRLTPQGRVPDGGLGDPTALLSSLLKG